VTTVALVIVALVLAALLLASAVLVVAGALTLDTGIGRRTRPLGPLRVSIAAPREAVFDALALPYLSPNPPRALREKVTVLERGADMVLASHRTRAGLLTTTTVEAVVFRRPDAISFRLVRGPVPHVVERFELVERDGRTELVYTGELGADFWLLGRVWAAIVARSWLHAVSGSMERVQESTERSAARLAARSRV
jgi:hypothetical protein